MFTKEKIFNLALGALLLSRRIVDATQENSNECVVLNTHWETALYAALEDMDLDSTSSQLTLALLETAPDDYPEWTYVYDYPTTCLILRRIKSCVVKDNRNTRIPLKVAMRSGNKCIFTNESEAIIECVERNIDLSTLTANTGLAIAYRLAILASPLIVGKGADKVRKEIEGKYLLAKSEAQEHDARENMNYDADEVTSEFVAARYE